MTYLKPVKPPETKPTELLTRFAAAHAQAKRAFEAAFSQLEVFRIIHAHFEGTDLSSVRPAEIATLLCHNVLISTSTAKRRANTLYRWLKWIKTEGNEQMQLGIFAGQQTEALRVLPDLQRFPQNEGDLKVRYILNKDLSQGDILLILGYASIDEVIKLLAQRMQTLSTQPKPAKVRILFGNEPFMYTARRKVPRQLSDELRDYWLNKGISIESSPDVFLAQQYLAEADVEIRIAKSRKLHAKIYLTEYAVTLGSSNFTYNGLGGQAEANVRFRRSKYEPPEYEPAEEQRYSEAQDLAEALWTGGEDYTADFEALLLQLLNAVSWQEALARGCAEILEGVWAQKYIPSDELDQLQPALWPHQLQGMSQALWTVHNLGSVLVADAAGSGKTRMGSWILRAIYDLQVRSGYDYHHPPVLITPPAVQHNWQNAVHESRLPIQPKSHGQLSQSHSQACKNILHDIETCTLLAVDEAHNFINKSKRTHTLARHFADNVVLFTATPINRSASDLLPLIELLGADHFSDPALEILKRLKRNANLKKESDLALVRQEIQHFLVRRTRTDLNQLSHQNPEQYLMKNGRQARYPHHQAEFYHLPLSPQDAEIAAEIVTLADQLKGVARIGQELYLPKGFQRQGKTEGEYLNNMLSAAEALSRYTILDCLRSSRAALYEHILGTTAALAKYFDNSSGSKRKSETGNMVEKLHQKSGQIPKWKFKHLKPEEAPAWLVNRAAHQEACAQEIKIYQAIAQLVAQLSSDRETLKIKKLIALAEDKGQIIAFDAHIISLQWFQAELNKRKIDCGLYSGAEGHKGKKDAVNNLGLDSVQRQFIALCSDALSEGMNLQGASVVMHLDRPTVIRIAEQRAGRVDRMDSAHDQVQICWPKDDPQFLPRKKDTLSLRHEMVKSLIRANLEMPLNEDDESESLDLSIEEMAEQANLESQRKAKQSVDLQGIFDAFRPVRQLIEPGGLVPEATYQAIKSSQSKVVSCVSAVKADQPWAFFAVGGADRMAPRWVLIHDLNHAPVMALDQVQAGLKERLSQNPELHELNQATKDSITELITHLGKSQAELLPRRKQKALKLAAELLKKWQTNAKEDHDFARIEVLKELEAYFSPDPFHDASPDLRAVAEIWLKLFRPYQEQFLEERTGKEKLLQLKNLKPALFKKPISTAQLQAAFREIDLLAPLSERIVAAIIGVVPS